MPSLIIINGMPFLLKKMINIYFPYTNQTVSGLHPQSQPYESIPESEVWIHQ